MLKDDRSLLISNTQYSNTVHFIAVFVVSYIHTSPELTHNSWLPVYSVCHSHNTFDMKSDGNTSVLLSHNWQFDTYTNMFSTNKYVTALYKFQLSKISMAAHIDMWNNQGT